MSSNLLEAAKKVVAQPGYQMECPGDDAGQPCQQCQERQALIDAIAHQEGKGPDLLAEALEAENASLRESLASALLELERATEQCVALRAENARMRQCLDLLRGAVSVKHAAWCPAVDLSPETGGCTCGMGKIVAALKGEVLA